MSLPDRPTPPPVFAITIVPFGAVVGYLSIAAPYWLERRGVSLAVVGGILGAAMAPNAFKFLWAPLVDLGGRRRLWFVATTLATAALLVAMSLLPDLAHHLGTFTALATAASVAGTTSAAAADGLMASTTRPEDQPRAAAWRMAGNVGGTGLLGSVALSLASRTSAPIAGLALAALVVLSAGAALLVHERPPPARAAGGVLAAAGRALADIGRDLWETARSRHGWTGLVICAVPVGAGALTNLFSAIGPSYGASEDLVGFANGIGGGITGALGSFLGGWLASRMNRRLAYGLSGVAIAACAGAMLAAPMTPATFAWGALLYNLATGAAFATLAAFILDMVGHGAAVATKYTLFIAVANLASSYVTALDGWASAFRGWGARGCLAADIALTLAGIGVLLAMVAVTRRGPAAAPRRAG